MEVLHAFRGHRRDDFKRPRTHPLEQLILVVKAIRIDVLNLLASGTNVSRYRILVP